MEKNKRYSTSLFVILCLLLNLSGKCLAQWLKLPIWMDSFGTIAATYVLGPVCGVIVGVTLNTLYSIIYSWTYICYAVVSALIAVIAGVAVSEVQGVASMAGGFAGGISEVFSGQKNMS